MPHGVFDDVEVMALYLSALGHDAGHFRLNNAFLKNSKHTLFKKYPESILENFHLGLLFELLDDEDVGIVEYLPVDDRERFREMCTYLIRDGHEQTHGPLQGAPGVDGDAAAALQGLRIFGDNRLRRGRH